MRIQGVLAACAVACLAVTGCASHQTVKPVQQVESRQICIIQNPSVRTGFVEAYRRALLTKGYAVRDLPPNAALTECPVTSTYSARWRWDLAMYMSYAELRVYSNGRPAGEALYDSQRGGANMSKFIEADRKVEELVNQLFPGGAGQ
jgi:hypothetical protein